MLVLLPINSNIRRCKIVFCAVRVLEFSLSMHACFLYPFFCYRDYPFFSLLLVEFFERCSLRCTFSVETFQYLISIILSGNRLLKRKCSLMKRISKTILVGNDFRESDHKDEN